MTNKDRKPTKADFGFLLVFEAAANDAERTVIIL